MIIKATHIRLTHFVRIDCHYAFCYKIRTPILKPLTQTRKGLMNNNLTYVLRPNGISYGLSLDQIYKQAG